MFENILTYIKRNIKLLLYLTLYLFVFCVVFRLLGHTTLQSNNDNLYQYEIFYREWIKITVNFIKTGKLNTYSFNTFLGSDFYSSMGYYCIGDIFLPFLLLFRNNIHLGLLIETILCVYISAITMSMFLKKRGIKKNNVITYISLIYAVGGQAIFYVQNYMFHRFFAFLPLLFYGVEYYFQNKKRSIFILAVSILFIQNYYFMYMTLIFLFFYSLVECLSRKVSLKKIVCYFFDLLFSIFVGFLLSAIFIFPSMISVMGNVASRKITNNNNFWELNAIIGIFSSIMFLNPYGAMPSLFNITYDFYGSWYNLFITIIPLGFILMNFFDKNNKKRNIFLLILFIVAAIKPLNSIMHGFSIPSLRWLFLLEFYLLYLASIYMDKEYNKNRLFHVLIGIIIVNFILIGILYCGDYVRPDMALNISYIKISILLNMVIVFLFKFTNILPYAVSIIYVLSSTVFYYHYLSSHNYIPLISKEEINYNQNYDSTYYRYYNSYLNSYEGLPLDSNSSLLYDIMTTSTYLSTYDTATNDFLEKTNNIVSLDWNVEISNPEALTMLGTKYYIVGDRIDELYSTNPSLEYKYTLRSFGEYKVYYNKDYRGFGYCAENIDYFDNYGKDNGKNFINTVYVDDKSYDLSKYAKLSYSQLNIIYMDDNYVSAEINNKEKNILLIPFPNNKGWTIYVNDTKTFPISVNGGFIGVELNEGFNKIEMRFSTPYLKEGATMSFIGLLVVAFVIMKERKIV